MSTLKRRISINFGSLNAARTAKEREKVRELSIGAGEVEEKRVTCYKTWVTHGHKSVNHPVVACRCGDK